MLVFGNHLAHRPQMLCVRNNDHLTQLNQGYFTQATRSEVGMLGAEQ